MCKVFLIMFLFALIAYTSGCESYAQPGETEDEGRRRHQRVKDLSKQQLMADLDRAGLVDKPSRATPLRVP
ncbi:MAG: hypothetical protein ACYSRR_08570 [Planctomycetota bacterium]